MDGLRDFPCSVEFLVVWVLLGIGFGDGGIRDLGFAEVGFGELGLALKIVLFWELRKRFLSWVWLRKEF